MATSFSVKVTTAVALSLVVWLALGLIAILSIEEFYSASRALKRMQTVHGHIDAILQDTERAEVVQYRFQLTGDPAASEEFSAMTHRVRGAIGDLGELLAEPEQKERLGQLDRVIADRFKVLAEAIRLRGSGTAAMALLFNERSMDSGTVIHRIAETIAEHDRQMIKAKEEQVLAKATAATWITFFANALAVIVLVWVVIVIRRYEKDRQRVEGELRRAQGRLTLALEASNSAVWDWDLAKDQIYLSAGWSQMLGAPAQESTIAPAALLELVHPDDLEQVRKMVRDTLKGVTADYHEEHRVRRTDGQWIWILSHGRVVQQDPGGRPQRMAGTNLDVTERKRIELALREHDQQLRLAMETAGMAGWRWEVASDEFTWLDTPEHLAGPVPAGGYSSLLDMVHPEDLVHFIRALNDVARGGEVYRDEVRITRGDGRVAWVLVRGRPEREADGKVTQVIGVAQDISEIKEAEQGLRASERQMRLVTNAVPAVISYQDAGERIRFCNQQMSKMLGLRQEEITGRSLRELFGEQAYQQFRPFILRALSGEDVHFERIHQSPRGPVDLSVTYVSRRNEMGEVEGFYTLATDVSDLKRLDRMKSEFVSTVSHELRTPLTSIRGSLGVLAGGIAGPLPDKARGFIDIAKNNCERLIRLINDILDMEKIESGKMTFQLRVFDLMELIEQVVKANEGFAAQHKVRLQVRAARPGPRVNADSDRLAQVLTNFISNACKFSPADSSVEVSVSAEGERLRVAVTDHGPGISEEFQKRIFQKFSQADSSDVRKMGGSGLGLSISKAIVEGLGGEVGFSTEAGKGSTFYFLLPELHEPSQMPAKAFSGRPRVLVCEDDADVGKLLQIMVDNAGCDSDLAVSAAEAKRLMRERRYAALTLDLRLPDQDGLSLLRELRADAASAAVPVIVVSATAQEGKLVIGGENLGVVDWLSKPIDEARLLENLRSALGAAGRLRVLHVEDDADVRKIVSTIARDICEFDAAESLAQARTKLEQDHFDLVLLDLGLPDGSGWELLSLINRLTPRPRVVIFSASDPGEMGEAAGYMYLVKSQTSERQLIDAIGAAVKGSG